MNLLDIYLQKNNRTLREFSSNCNIPTSTLRNLNYKELSKWTVENINQLSNLLKKENTSVLHDLEKLEYSLERESSQLGQYDLSNRRYIGSKRKMLNKIYDLIELHTNGDVFFDVFAGTGIVTEKVFDKFEKFIVNDFLYSNEQIYYAFFGNESINFKKLKEYKLIFRNIKYKENYSNYFSDSFGGKFFSHKDAFLIGEIREKIEHIKDLNSREKSVLISSLVYSADKISNTVGHYDAYRKIKNISDQFEFNLVNAPEKNLKNIQIFREDSNKLVKSVNADVAFIDPPYNSRQYSRFYHVLENLVKWEKPNLHGVALKPEPENMSEYSKVSAPIVFDDLIQNLNAKYIVVTYNNTYNSKSKSSRNKITHEEILESLDKVGETQVFEIPFQYFSAGKTHFQNHKEFIFITEVRSNER